MPTAVRPLHARFRDGTPVVVRPIVPEDKTLLREGFERCQGTWRRARWPRLPSQDSERVVPQPCRSDRVGSRLAYRLQAGLFLLALAPIGPIAAQEPLRPTTVILVRHAEKSVPLGDYPLSGAGRARARELARVLGSANIAAIYTTDYLRTRQTAEPLAARLGVPVTTIKTTKTYVTDVLDRIGTEHTGHTVLVVSHSLTIPALIEALGVTAVPTIEEEQYDRLFVVTVPATGPVGSFELRYGRPSR